MSITRTELTATTFTMEGAHGAIIRARVRGVATVSFGDDDEPKMPDGPGTSLSEMLTADECREAARLFEQLAAEIDKQEGK